MGGVGHRIRALAMALGAPGLFLVAFLDSSFLTLPEIADVLVVLMVTRHKGLLAWYVISATLGSIAGCLILYVIGLKGGAALVRKRFASGRVERTLALFERHGIMAVLVPSVMPPPTPFKIFVLLAGVAGITLPEFVGAIALGRGVRFLALGLLAARYGDQTIGYLRAHGATVSLIVVALLVAGFAVTLIWRKARAASNR
jgi:membrane protein YqaA with SNARE-associated domain